VSAAPTPTAPAGRRKTTGGGGCCPRRFSRKPSEARGSFRRSAASNRKVAPRKLFRPANRASRGVPDLGPRPESRSVPFAGVAGTGTGNLECHLSPSLPSELFKGARRRAPPAFRDFTSNKSERLRGCGGGTPWIGNRALRRVSMSAKSKCRCCCAVAAVAAPLTRPFPILLQ
jgi:hypothetical protein